MNKIRKLFFVFGLLCIFSSFILCLYFYINIHLSIQENEKNVHELYNRMPSIENGILLDDSDEMPMVEINQENFVGIIEIPRFNRILPVGGIWNKNLLKYPLVYKGSIYDRSLIIGGSDSKKQFDFMTQINEKDKVFFIDMKGKRFSYEIEKIEITKDISNLNSSEYDLIIFVKNTYSFDYTILKCNYKL